MFPRKILHIKGFDPWWPIANRTLKNNFRDIEIKIEIFFCKNLIENVFYEILMSFFLGLHVCVPLPSSWEVSQFSSYVYRK